MKANTGKTAVALLGTVALASSAVVGVAPALAADASVGEAVGVVQAGEAVETEAAGIANVQGVFAFDQNAVSGNGYLSQVFGKAAATMCASVPDYCVPEVAQKILVGGSAATAQIVATVADLFDEDEATNMILACSCATNVAGGGAIANAEVEGVSLENIAVAVGAR